VNTRVATGIADAYRLGITHTPTQDVEYAVNQLVEVAVRAMSPAINDPFTAMNCLDYLGSGLAVIAACPPYQGHIYDANRRLRLLVDSHSFAELLDAAFDMIRRAGRENADVLLSILRAIEVIGRKAYSDDYRTALLHRVQLVGAESDASSSVAWVKERVGRRCADLLSRLEARLPGNPIDVNLPEAISRSKAFGGF
jgi:uncharacterized membrane protein